MIHTFRIADVYRLQRFIQLLHTGIVELLRQNIGQPADSRHYAMPLTLMICRQVRLRLAAYTPAPLLRHYAIDTMPLQRSKKGEVAQRTRRTRRVARKRKAAAQK